MEGLKGPHCPVVSVVPEGPNMPMTLVLPPASTLPSRANGYPIG